MWSREELISLVKAVKAVNQRYLIRSQAEEAREEIKHEAERLTTSGLRPETAHTLILGHALFPLHHCRAYPMSFDTCQIQTVART